MTPHSSKPLIPPPTPGKLGWCVALLLLFTLVSPGWAAQIISLGSGSWKYFIGTQEASSPITAWRQLGFNDTSWSNGVATIGYPSAAPGVYEQTIQTTLPTSTAANYVSVFFRRPFTVNNAGDITQLTLTLRIDDGYAAWINGTLVGSNNIPATLAFNQIAPAAAAEDVELVVNVPPGVLANGANVLALQVFNNGTGSTDLVMDAALSSVEDTQGPVQVMTEPEMESVVIALPSITVHFDENVTGINASDLLINGVAATNMTEYSPLEYAFFFPSPPTGVVNVAWVSGHGITDLRSTPHPFAGGSWTYTLNPNAGASTLIISEFMADNENAKFPDGSALRDEDGTRSDWIEIYNPGPLEANLGGWSLTDTGTNSNPASITNLTKWRFPAVVLGANKYLLVWASDKNKTNPLAPLHTNFRLGKGGGYLALVDPQTNIVSSFAPYGAQVTDKSYGRDKVDPNVVGYYDVPTAGIQNSTTGTGFSAEPVFSHASGVYTNDSFLLTIMGPAGATIRYTTDSSEPTNGSPAYASPITVNGNVTIKARVYQVGLWPGPVRARAFVMLDSTTRNFSSDIPIVVIATPGDFSTTFPGAARKRGTLTVIDTFRGRAKLTDEPDFHGLGQFEIFGQSSQGWPKKSHNMEINDELGNDQAASLLGLPAEADWKMRTPYADKCLMNDFLAYELFEQMGHYSCRRRMVEVFRDTGGGKLTYPGDYYGVLVLLEKIEIDKNRVDLARLTPSHTNDPAISGGYIFKRDKNPDPPTSGEDLNFTTTAGTPLKLHDPKPREVNNNVNHPQVQWLRRYLSAYETAVNAANWTTATGTNHYSHYIDVDTFVDQHWIVEFPKQIDGYRISNYFSKDRNGKVKNAPIWDWNLAFGNANYLDGGNTNGWYYTQAGAGDHLWLRRLLGASPLPASGGDPDFIQKVIDRWGTLRTNIFEGQRVVNRIDEIAAMLNESAGRNYQKYNVLGSYLWPNPDGPNLVPSGTDGTALTWHINYATAGTYSNVISEMKKWTMGRYLWIDSLFPKAPTFSMDGGSVAAGSLLAISAPAGIIYYTLDGTDPRQSQANGAVAAGAQTFSGAITVNTNVRVFARARNGNVWSPPTIATYVVQTPRLVITEIMYHPLPPPAIPATTNTDEDFEYIELKNVGPSTLNLNGYSISGGVDFTFPNINLAAGARVLVVKNQAAFTSRYGTSGLTIAGQYTGNLANEGNRLVLWGRMREPILDFEYDDEWYPITDGFGFSLVVVDEDAAASAWGSKTQWRPSGVLNGTPGQADGASPVFPQVVISEAFTHSDPPPPTDTIELQNLSGSIANISGWYLSDDFREPKKFRIPDGTSIAPGGFITFDEGDFNTPSNAPTSFGLSSTGDEVYLFSADLAGNLTGYQHGFEFGAQRNGITFGRHVTSLGEEHFVALTSPTLGSANAPLLIGPVVISEIMYHPPDVFANGAYWNNSEDEFVELRNISGAAVGLFDPARTTNTWKLDNAVEYAFPAGTTIPAGGTVLVVNFDPVLNPAQSNALRLKYSIPAGIRMFGPYGGDLSNEDENVALYRPDNPTLDGEVPYVLVDNVRYRDIDPWPSAADGYGQSLQRLNALAYADDVANWVAGGPTPGSSFVSGTAPTITGHPTNQAVTATTTAIFVGSASGPGPLRYQWRFKGGPLSGATNSTLVLANVQLSQAGKYQLVALNPFGAAVSEEATLVVLVPPNVTQNPQSQRVGEGASAVFSVIATTVNPPLRYQWFRNGIPINGATNSSYSIVNAAEGDDNTTWYATLTDASGTVQTPPATLTVLIVPSIVEPVPALNMTVVQGETVTLGARLRGSRPIHLRWRRFNMGSLSGGTQMLEQSNYLAAMTFLTINNIATNQTGMYTLLMTNIAGGSHAIIGVRTNALVTVLSDSNTNGIPDFWESTYFGSATGADRNLDSDGDGLTNWEEYTAGTDPTNSVSYLQVENITPSAGATLSFQAVSNRTYSILYKDGVTTANYTKLADVIARTTNWTATVVDPAPSPNRYYRLTTPKL